MYPIVFLSSCLYLLVLIPPHHCNGSGEVVYYVTPTLPPNPDCPDGLPCHTLAYYFSNSLFTEQTINLSMIFLTGQHKGICQQTELKSLSFSASGVDQEVAINCTTIVFSNAVSTFFENLTFDHCMWYYTVTVPPRILYLILEISSVIFQNQTHVYIEHASNVSGNRVKLVNTVFNNSSMSGVLSFFSNEGAMFLANSTLTIGKNTSIIFVKNRVHPSIYLKFSTLTVESNVQITFFNNLRCALMMKFSALNIMKKTNIYFISNSNANDEGIAINVERSTLNTEGDLFFANNSGERETVCIQTSTFSIRNNAVLQFINNSAKGQAGGMLVFYTKVNVEDNTSMIFIDNTGSKIGAMAVLWSTLYVRNNANLSFIRNSVSTESGALAAVSSSIYYEDNAHGIFIQNSAETFAGAMALWSSTLYMKHNTNITFIDNSANVNGGAMVVAGTDGLLITGLHLSSNATMIFINNSVIGVGGALFIYSSRFILANASSMTIKFVGNSAKSGGAIVLLSSSLELLGGNSSITFVNNSVKENGGAILVQPDLLYYTVPYLTLIDTHCLYKTNSSIDSDLEEHLFYFVNNSANISGDDIYGASLAWCNGNNVYTIPRYSSSLSSISGDPLRVCICDNKKTSLCRNLSHNHIAHSFTPGEVITILVVVVGGDWGATLGVVHAYPSSSAKILPTQYHQWITKAECTQVSYTVYSNQSVQLMLSPHDHSSTKGISPDFCDYIPDNFTKRACEYCSPLYVNLTVLPCPPGFSLQGDPGAPYCDCYHVFTSNGVECSIINGVATFSWNTSLWISTSSNKIRLSKHCPFDYCKNTKQQSDDQCDFDRTGRLCGTCKEKYSLAIGSSHCIYCSNDYNLALFIFFAAAGFLIVLFISAFNLTVTDGKINGLIFYANVVWTYKSILLPKQISSELVFFKTFIAWVNLDFGIETCFINNFNAFWKSWLQFVFPFYLWSIAGLMIVLARYSTRLTILFGNRAVPVLSTLILLSYMKLLRTATEILHFSVLMVYGSSPNDTATITLVWSVDGTLDYFGHPHILLFVAALFTLLFLWLPYTLLLLLIQWIRRISHYSLLTWTTRLNPFYDANLAPLKYKHQYWFGVLLLSRGIILVAFATNFAIPSDINLLILLIFSGVLLFYMLTTSLYKSHALLAFQSSFFLNLCFLSGFIIFSHTKSKIRSSMQTSAAVLSIAVTFLQFCCIIVYQIYACHSGRVRISRRRTIVQLNDHEEQSHAILDISSRYKNQEYSAEEQPLMDPNPRDSDDSGQ